MNFKLLGGMLLVVGTSIGAGMLALPIATASMGFWTSLIFLFLVWSVMTYSAFLILEVNLWLPEKTNLISMCRATLGFPGQCVAWVSYLLLLYCLLSAYIAGGGDILHHLFLSMGISVPEKLDALIFAVLIASIVYQGISAVDHVNRYLMAIKLVSLFSFIFLTIPHVNAVNLVREHISVSMAVIVLIITSFGFGTIVPSLRVYYKNDLSALRTVILFGSLIPFVCYVIWIWVIQGVLPEKGPHGLFEILQSGGSPSALMQSLTLQLEKPWITTFIDIFASFSIATSFLGVSLGLVDFLSDGLNMPKIGFKKIILFLFAFLPPLLIVFVNPAIFIKGLNYAGTCCIVLLMLLPALMVWRGRYSKNIAVGYRVMGGRTVLITVMLGSILAIIFGF